LLDAEPGAAELGFLVTAMAAWWVGAPQVARMVTGLREPQSATARERQRQAVVTAARRMALTRPAAQDDSPARSRW
jgi:hypothetical protein